MFQFEQYRNQFVSETRTMVFDTIRQVATIVGIFVMLTFFGSGSVSGAADEDSVPVIREFGLLATMRDGVRLSTDVYRPDVAEQVPAILVRTPYTRTTAQHFKAGQSWASMGYAYIVQDVRGRGDSEGNFNPLAQETNDGFDSQSWAAGQPWSNGKVGTTGGSYLGWTQMLPASLNNPALKAMIPMVTPPDPGGYWPQRDGAVALALLEWALVVEGRTSRSFGEAKRDLIPDYLSVPIREIDNRIGLRLNIWQDYLDNLDNPAYWEPRSYQHRLHQSRAPMLHVTGWYDGTLGGALQNYPIMREKGDAAARDHQYMIIGPWRHWIGSDSKNQQIGDIDFGPASRLDLDTLYRQWFDHYLRGDAVALDSWPRARLFVMNANRWLEADDWPVPGTRFTPYYLAGNGNNIEQGVLKTSPRSADSKADTYRYDPSDPTPFIWEGDIDSGGPDDYARVDARSDVLTYTLETPDQPVTICGPITADIHASSSAKDTDWIARLSLVHPSGYVQRLTEGWVRARSRNGDFLNEPLEPGKVEKYSIDLWGTCVEIGRGFTLRLTVMSAAFPLISRNLNTGGDQTTEVDGVIANQTVFHDALRPSSVMLPVLPASSQQ
jgi:putative CocE/NonD family hydrolase